MKRIIIATAALLAWLQLSAQNADYTSTQNGIGQVLVSIEQNNTSLKALREEVKAQQIGNRTGIFPAGPEVEFNYLWGNPSAIGSRKDFSISQSFDFATISGMKSGMAKRRDMLADLQYKANRQAVLLQAKQLCIDLVYYNALHRELETRLAHAQTIADAYAEKLKRGEANMLEVNKAQMNLSNAQGEVARVEVERQTLLGNLQQLNGGVAVALDGVEYSSLSLPANFETWYEEAEQKNPLLGYVRQQIEVNRQEVRVNRALNLPQLSAGFMSESTLGQKYQGVSVGISIPLWGNKNKVKQAKANVRAAEMRQQEARQYFYDQLQTLYHRAEGFRQTAQGYRHSLTILNSTVLLSKALNAGEISLLDYMTEIGFYYEVINKTLIAERDFEKAKAELYAVEL